jgi:Zn finger protein HypA/HybF involved in hydrogenase expression
MTSILSTLATIAICITALALLTLALLVSYRVSLKRHPYTDCRRCKGTGERRSRLFANSFGHCPTCTGTGYQLRAGARLFNVR